MTLDRLAPAIFVFLWSTGWVAAKYAGFYADPLTFLTIRFAVAAVIFYGLCRVAGVAWPRGRMSIVHVILSGAFLHGLYLGMVWWAIGQGVPAAISGIIAGLQPLMTAVAAPLIVGERLAIWQKVGLGLGFLGIGIAVLPNLFALGDNAIPAFAVMINVIGMGFVTLGTLYQKRFVRDGDLRSVATLQYVGAVAVTLPAAMLLEDLHVDWQIGFFVTMIWSVVGISMGAILLLLYLIRRGAVSKAASLIYLVPPLAALEAAIVFGERLTVPMIIGTVLAVVGVYLTNRRGAERQA
ncbi:DMT family transporter [Agrobacterium sp. ES01]|uniref:DMT family transporter n=1 Tax=Agrobacterium sp. ES01 TaxID=3420714 RepID=UPI003D100491